MWLLPKHHGEFPRLSICVRTYARIRTATFDMFYQAVAWLQKISFFVHEILNLWILLLHYFFQKLNVAVVVLVCWTRFSLFLVCFCIPAFPVCFHTPLFFGMCICLMYEIYWINKKKSYEMLPKLNNVIKSSHYFRNVNLDKVQIKFNNSEKSRLWIPFLT